MSQPGDIASKLPFLPACTTGMTRGSGKPQPIYHCRQDLCNARRKLAVYAIEVRATKFFAAPRHAEHFARFGRLNPLARVKRYCASVTAAASPSDFPMFCSDRM